MMWSVALLVMAIAVAQEPRTEEVPVEADSAVLHSFDFELESCDRVRLYVPAKDSSPGFVRIRLVNKTAETCSYHGISLKGFVEGTYTTVPGSTPATGVHIEPGETLFIKVAPNTPNVPRDRLKLEIPPDQNVLIFRGYSD